MKHAKYLIFSLLLVPFVANADITHDLYYGLQSNQEVSSLQEFLTDEGLYSGPITGNFYSLTLKSVKAFQVNNSINPTGYVGPLTRNAINSILNSQGISLGVKNEDGDIINPPITAPKTNDDVVAKLNEQINLMTAQLNKLQEQQANLVKQNETLMNIQQTQSQTQQTLGQIQQNTTPVVVQPVVTPVVVVPVDKSEILVETRTYPENAYVFVISVLDKDGKYLHDFKVKMNAEDDINASNPNYQDTLERGVTSVSNDVWYTAFSYKPTSSGTKTITFTSGNLSKTITIDVQ